MDSIDISHFLRTPIKTRQLLLLIALDEHRNIHRASEVLHMTQPGASKQLKELEDLLEVTLFERSSRGMEPTPFGKIMIRYAQMALSNLASAQGDIQTLKSGLIGRVRVGAIPTPAMTLFPGVIAKLSEHAPELRISVEVALSNALLEKLQSGSLDFIIGHVANLDDDSNLHCELLRREPPSVVVARTGHPLAERVELTLGEMAPYPWILPMEGSPFRSLIEGMFYRGGCEPPSKVVEANDQMLVLKLVQQTNFLTILPVAVANYYVPLNVITILHPPLDWPDRPNSFGITTRSDRLLSAGAELFLSTLRAEAALLDMLP